MQKNSLVIMLGSRIVVNCIASLLPGGWWVGFFDFVLLDSAPVFFPKNTFSCEENNESDESIKCTRICVSKFKILKGVRKYNLVYYRSQAKNFFHDSKFSR